MELSKPSEHHFSLMIGFVALNFFSTFTPMGGSGLSPGFKPTKNHGTSPLPFKCLRRHLMNDFKTIKFDCPYLSSGATARRPANAYNVEWFGPADRCRAADGQSEALQLRSYNLSISLREDNPSLYLPMCCADRCPRLKG